MSRCLAAQGRPGLARSFPCARLVERAALKALPVAGILVVFGCEAKFSGPYACEQGYASCSNPEENRCETYLPDDGLNCGSCGRTCDVGAICRDSQCIPAATKLADAPGLSNPLIAVNGSGVFWSSFEQGRISRAPLNGGPQTIVTSFAGGNTSPGDQAIPFALDENQVYFFANNYPFASASPVNSGITKYSVSGGDLAMVVPTFSGYMGPLAMAVDSSRLYWLDSQSKDNSDIAIVKAMPLAGGASSTVVSAEMKGNVRQHLVLGQGHALLVVDQGNLRLESVDMDGGSPIAIPTPDGLGAVAADPKFVYTVSSSCKCSCGNCRDGNDVGLRPQGTVDRFGFDGSGARTLGQFLGLVTGAALDEGFVYFTTERTLLKVPVDGGTPVVLADNLDPGASPYECSSNCGGSGPSPPSISIAVDSTSVYIANASPKVGAILKVGK